MSDYLRRLVQRERGVAPVIEPRLPSRFEPWPGHGRPFADASAEPLDVSGEIAAAPARAEDAPPPAPCSSTTVGEGVERAALGNRTETAAQVFSPPGETTRDALRDDRAEDAAPTSQGADSKPAFAVRPLSAKRQETQRAQAPEARAAFDDREAAPSFWGAQMVASASGPNPVGSAGGTRRADRAGGAAPAPHARETIVEVRIGRIDVRATPAPTAAPPPRAPPDRPRRSLDDFLSGGRKR
jgi:hypothetical protein